jgi:phosphatidylglycerophosphate synthase
MSTGRTDLNRRPISARGTRWAAACARALARAGATPNAISVASIGFAGLGGLAFAATDWTEGWRRAAWFVGAAAGIQLRLLCNLFDGMVAIEGGRRSKSGEIFNELPDRFADWAVLLGAGYAAGSGPHGPALGWAAALLAVLTAYIRALGTATGARSHFEGPMAKQHRMATLTVAAVAAAVAAALGAELPILQWALGLVVIGAGITVARRTVGIVRELEAR